jgi:hypothetical protein
MTRSRRRETIRAERDLEIADLLDGYARLVRAQEGHECAGKIATAVEGLASSLRAGVLD